jgi:hypothetical protein
MSLSKLTFLAAGLALALSTPGIATKASAQGAQNSPTNMLSDVGEDDVILISPKGKVMKTKITKGKGAFKKAQAAGMREIKGAMIIRRGGKIYLLEDKPGKAAGKSMVQESFQDHFDVNQY